MTGRNRRRERDYFVTVGRLAHDLRPVAVGGRRGVGSFHVRAFFDDVVLYRVEGLARAEAGSGSA